MAGFEVSTEAEMGIRRLVGSSEMGDLQPHRSRADKQGLGVEPDWIVTG